MTRIDFPNDDRFSRAPPWIVEQLVDVPFFSVGDNDSQSFHAVIVLKDGERIGVPVYGRKWIKLNVDELKAVTRVLYVLPPPQEMQIASADRSNGHQLRAQKGADMSDNEKDDRTTETQAMKCDLLAVNAAICHDDKYVLLTIRMNPNSFQVTEILIPLSQARDRLQLDLADLLARSPVFEDQQ